MPQTPHDVIDMLVGIAPGSALDAVRARRGEARKHAQASYTLLFTPEDFGGVSAAERFAIAAFVAGLHGKAETEAFYTGGLEAAGGPELLPAAIAAEIKAAKASGPYGHYPKGPLSAEDEDGLIYKVDVTARPNLGPRLPAALEHVHMLVLHPRDASAASLQAMLDAGWSTTDIVVISQLVSFLSYQIRVVAGLRMLAARPAAPVAA